MEDFSEEVRGKLRQGKKRVRETCGGRVSPRPRGRACEKSGPLGDLKEGLCSRHTQVGGRKCAERRLEKDQAGPSRSWSKFRFYLKCSGKPLKCVKQEMTGLDVKG